MPKKIFITGSSKGIGAAIARAAKKNGYEVIIHGKTKSKALLSLGKEINARHLVFDLNNEKEVKKAILSIKKLDILINSAGINISKSFLKLNKSDWGNIYNTNLFGLVNVIKNAIPILKYNSSTKKIINIASVKGTYSAVGRVAYASSKAALINLTTGLAKELAPNVHVNCVSPGFVNTSMTRKTWNKRIKKQVKSILLKRIANVDEIANVILFLCSDKCSYMTGQNIIVDGGFTIKNE